MVQHTFGRPLLDSLPWLMSQTSLVLSLRQRYTPSVCHFVLSLFGTASSIFVKIPSHGLHQQWMPSMSGHQRLTSVVVQVPGRFDTALINDGTGGTTGIQGIVVLVTIAVTLMMAYPWDLRLSCGSHTSSFLTSKNLSSSHVHSA